MKVGLVLEGGALRGLYTAGVLDVMLDNKIDIDGIIGVSAGALFGVNYFSNQKGRVIRYSLNNAKNLRYMSVLSFLLTGNVVNKKYAYYKMSETIDPFDNDAFIKNNKDFYLVATNIETGKPDYIKITDPINEMEALRATSAIPMYSKIIEYNGNKYLDGAIADSIPYLYFKSLGYDKIIIVLTRDISYSKKDLIDRQIEKINKKYGEYPNLIDAMKSRPHRYNETLDIIKKAENKEEVFVIRPSEPIDINVIERDKNKLLDVYNLGVKDMNDNILKLKEYIKTS